MGWGGLLVPRPAGVKNTPSDLGCNLFGLRPIIEKRWILLCGITQYYYVLVVCSAFVYHASLINAEWKIMQQRQLLSTEFVTAIMPVLLELGHEGHEKFNRMAYQMAVDMLFDCPNNLNLGLPGRSGNPPLFYYFSLTTQGRYVITSQPGLFSAISDETLNYRHNAGTTIIENFCGYESRRFFEHKKICKKIDPALLREQRAKLFQICPDIFYKDSPLAEAIDAKSFFTTLCIEDIYSHINEKDDSPIRRLLTDYRELREALSRRRATTPYYQTKHNLFEKYSWLKALIDNDAKELKDLAAAKEKEARAAAEKEKQAIAAAAKEKQATTPPEPGLLDKIGRLFNSKPEPDPRYQELSNPINEPK